MSGHHGRAGAIPNHATDPRDQDTAGDHAGHEAMFRRLRGVDLSASFLR